MGKDDAAVATVLKMLNEEKRVVTTKYCSHRLHVTARESKELLKNVYESHKADDGVVPVFAVQCSKSDGDVEKFEMKLVQGENEAQKINGDAELYALAPHVVEDVAGLCFSTDALVLRQLLNDDPHCLASISNPHMRANCVKPPTVSSQQTQSAANKKTQNSVPSSVVSNNKVSEAKPAPAAAEKKTDKAEAAPKQQQQNLFSKRPGATATTKEAKEDSGKTTTKATAMKPEKTSPPKKSAVKSPTRSKATVKTTIDVDEKSNDDQPITKKNRSRRVVDDDDDDEVEEVNSNNNKNNSNKESTKMVVDEVEAAEEHEQPEAEDLSSAMHVDKSTSGGGDGARRLVERTYVDDEGYFVTEKTWTHDSAGAAGSSTKAAEPAAAKSKPAPAPAKPATKKQPAQPAKGKQTSLTSFFKKA